MLSTWRLGTASEEGRRNELQAAVLVTLPCWLAVVADGFDLIVYAAVPGRALPGLARARRRGVFSRGRDTRLLVGPADLQVHLGHGLAQALAACRRIRPVDHLHGQD